MPFEIKQATRVGVIPLLGAFGGSGTGKTMSSLLLARGIAGPEGKIVMVDSETRRGSLYADVIPGGYEVLDLEAPFSPARYVEALTAAFESKPAAVVVDSMSHEHEGPGGVLDMAAEIERTSGKTGLHCWKVPKFEHAKMVQFLLRAPVPVICCIRAKYKTRQVKGTAEMAESGAIRRNQIGQTVILKDEYSSPIQAEDFVYELTAHFEVLPNHCIRLTKVNHPDLRKCFPEDSKGMLTIEHGAAIARWCLVPTGGPGTAAPAASTPADPAKAAKEKLWKLLKPVEAGDTRSWGTRNAWLRERKIIKPDEEANKLSEGALLTVIEETTKQISTGQV